MLDFFKISTRSKKQGVTEIYPNFMVNNKSKDLMIRGGDFYAIWVEDRGLWSTDEDDVIKRFLDRDYEPNGKGGLFTIKNCRQDLRKVEIWYQLCWYLDSFT